MLKFTVAAVQAGDIITYRTPDNRIHRKRVLGVHPLPIVDSTVFTLLSGEVLAFNQHGTGVGCSVGCTFDFLETSQWKGDSRWANLL